MFFHFNVPPPKVLAYDDGCHLKRFLENRANMGSLFSKWLLGAMDIVVDKCAAACTPPSSLAPSPAPPVAHTPPSPPPYGTRRRFHWPNHKDNKYCRENVDPGKCKALTEDMNTEAAEEVRSPRARRHQPRLASPPTPHPALTLAATASPRAHACRHRPTPRSRLPPPPHPALTLAATAPPCAQSFAWLARSKHLFRHMNEARFNFIMLRLMELRNRHLCATGVRARA